MNDLRLDGSRPQGRSPTIFFGWSLIAFLCLSLAVQQPAADENVSVGKAPTGAVSCLSPADFEAVRRCSSGRY